MSPTRRPAKLVSGGQTGVDRAALNVALELGLPCGGWCPKGRLAEDGPISSRYPLAETTRAEYAQRTRWNVRDSDGTLILTRGELTGGTALTRSHAEKLGRPVLVIDLDEPLDTSLASARHWLETHQITVLNVAGPRESTSPGIAESAARLLQALLARTEL